MLTCIILDDEPLAVKLLKEYVATVPDLELVLAGSDVYAGLELVQAGKADLVFLDVQMPDLTGIQFLKIINGKAAIVLTTAYEEYALQAFDLDVVDYLLKPFSPERFQQGVQKARNRIAALQPAPTPAADYIFVKSAYRMLKIALPDIYYLESLRDYVAIHHKEGKTLTLQSLKSFEEQLQDQGFLRIHKSYMVAIAAITAIERKKIKIGETALPVGDTYQEAVRRLITPS